MKRAILLLIILCFINKVYATDNDGYETEKEEVKITNVFHGYQNIKWGSSLQIVKKHFKKLKKIKSEIEKTTSYEQTFPNKRIRVRKFCFYKDKLWLVGVWFASGLKKKTQDLLWEKINEKFGPVHWMPDRNTFAWTFNSGKMYVKLTIWGSYTIGGFSEGDLSSIIFYDLEINDEVEEAQLEEETEDIDDF